MIVGTAVTLVAGSLAAAAVAFAEPDPTTVLANDFESTYVPWSPRGPVILALSDEAHDGSASLGVTGRTASWNGPATDATTLLEPGQTYSITAWAKLPAGTVGTTGIHFTMQHTPSDGSGDAYDWIGSSVTTGADTWVQLGGEYTFPTAQSAASLYVEAEGDTTPFLLDDLVITGPPAAPPPVQTVSSVDFEDGTTGAWSQSGGGTDTLTVVSGPDGGQVLRVNDRDADYIGLQSPTGLFLTGKTYTLSMKVRLAAGTEGAAGVRFVMKPQYEWIGNTTMTADAWTTVTADWTAPGTAPSGTDPTTLQVYLGTGDLSPAAPYTYLVDDILITVPSSGPTPGIVSSTDFESGLNGWQLRQADDTPATLATSTEQAHGGSASAKLADRDSQGDGLGLDVTGLTEPGVTYHLTAWVRFAPDAPTDAVWLSLARTTGATTSYSTLGQFDTVTNEGFTKIETDFTVGAADSALLYFETRYFSDGSVGNTSDLYFDDITLEIPAPPVVQELTPLKDTVDFPIGVAIDSRETTGSPAALLLRHFDQVTPENHFKPDAWYDADGHFQPSPDAVAIMDFARDNHLRVYGHTLVWHQQTPDWFFQDDQGNPLTNSAADQAILRQRLHDHIANIATWLATNYGQFGAGNPIVAFDVVNETVSDAADSPEGLRTSRWYQILGPDYIDLAFQYANEAFNVDHAAPGAVRPVTLFINDYNSEQGAKQDRYYALVQRLLAAGVPVDGVGHQFHLSVSTPVASLGAALDRFASLPVQQAVTELDVTLPTPVTQAELIEQGYYYRDAFTTFRDHDLFSVTVWGINDARSWRATQAPTIFDGSLQAKPAYFGIADQAELPAHLRTANVFGGDLPLTAAAFPSPVWRQLPPLPVGDAGTFGLRWTADHLTALVSVASDAIDAIEFSYGGSVHTFYRGGSGDVPGVVDDSGSGWRAVVHLPHSGVTQGSTGALDVRLLDGGTVVDAWNSPGAVGTLSFLEPLSFTEVVQARQAPVIDGSIDAAWSDANAVQTTTLQGGAADGATATVRTLWQNDTLYVLFEVTDPTIDVSSSDAYQQDSVEVFVDPGNAKNGSYRPADAQLRINVNNVHSFGAGDAAAQEGRLRSATSLTATGYRVEAAVTLSGEGGLATFQGLDFQVNDGTAGSRTSVHSWAEPTGTGYQTTARWGVGQLVGPVVAAWNASTVYGAGDWVTYQGSFWQAQWYSQNQTPGDPYGPWLQMVTADDGTPVWTPSRIFTSGDIVVYDGHVWYAKWWTRNQAPGDPYGPWRLEA